MAVTINYGVKSLEGVNPNAIKKALTHLKANYSQAIDPTKLLQFEQKQKDSAS